MDFSDWIKLQRTKEGWNQQQLQIMSGVDRSSINRIENKKTQVSLISAIRLWKSFKVSFFDLLADLEILYKEFSWPTLLDEQTSLSMELGDLLAFISYGMKKKKASKEFIQHWNMKASSIIRQLHGPFEIVDAKQFWDPNYFYPYPSHISMDHIHSFLSNGTALTYADAGSYLLSLRASKFYFTQKRLEIATGVSVSAIGRLERGELSKISFNELITLNNGLSDNSMLLGLYWMAGLQRIQIKNLLVKRSSRQDAMKIWPIEHAANNLVRLDRWLLYDLSLHAGFILDLRDIVKNEKPN